VKKVLVDEKPEFSWSEKLVDVKDYKKHKTFFTPKINKKGAGSISESLPTFREV